MDFIIDIMKTEKQLSPEEIEDLKEKRDEFTIPKKKLKIYYEMPLGDGVSSTVYIGFIHGKSPLSITTNLIETQRFQDCKVAVKVPSTFGSDESDQLFREIDSMKKIGYHQNVICMLGVCFLNEKPVDAFELADKDFFGQAPYPALGLNDLKEFLKAGNRLSCPQAATEEIYEIMLNCWNEYPEERPTFETLVNVFHGILEKATKSYGYVESSMDE
uniref:Tyrosine-protein kinase catalytic domain-containing protein n=1 Tax=Acrobeloides nanus TaxID=290746 RepID=A0A914EGK8_9BILA